MRLKKRSQAGSTNSKMFDMAKSALDSAVDKEIEEGSEILVDLKLELEDI